MKQKMRTYWGILTLGAILAVTISGCGNSPANSGDWAANESFHLISQPLTSKERDKIQSVLAPDGNGLNFADEGFSFKNMELSDEERDTPANSAKEAIKIAEDCLRSLGLMPEDHYYVKANTLQDEKCSSVYIYPAFHNVPILLKGSPKIRIGVCEKGISAIFYYNRYTIETVEQTKAVYISEDDAKKSFLEKYATYYYSSEYERDEDCFQRVYVYTEEKAIPMFMFGDDGDPFLNAIFVDAVSGEATDYPWEEADS